MMKNFPDFNEKMHRSFFAAPDNPNNLECFCDLFFYVGKLNLKYALLLYNLPFYGIYNITHKTPE